MSKSPNQSQRFTANKPPGHVAAIQRYSATQPASVKEITVLYLGMQLAQRDAEAFIQFQLKMAELLRNANGAVNFDFAHFDDAQGFHTHFVVAYWYSESDYQAWSAQPEFLDWWTDPEKTVAAAGYFREAFTSTLDFTETIAFKEYIRGLSACPMSLIAPMGESGYWGAARDRIAASAYDRLESSQTTELVHHTDRNTANKRITIVAPKNLTLIRSGVSWTDCGEEQLNSYLDNLKPALDAGMDYLRSEPVDTGCCCLRQVDVITADTAAVSENYCAGYFLTLAHLEHWAKSHPTHLAIFGQAQNERRKYQDKLELRTYHEVFVINKSSQFEYVNCHNQTGLLPWFEASEITSPP